MFKARGEFTTIRTVFRLTNRGERLCDISVREGNKLLLLLLLLLYFGVLHPLYNSFLMHSEVRRCSIIWYTWIRDNM